MNKLQEYHVVFGCYHKYILQLPGVHTVQADAWDLTPASLKMSSERLFQGFKDSKVAFYANKVSMAGNSLCHTLKNKHMKRHYHVPVSPST